jgi:alpha-tubulin suppressor-like RCC1 family protein
MVAVKCGFAVIAIVMLAGCGSGQNGGGSSQPGAGSIAAGAQFSCAVHGAGSDRAVYCWGENREDELGIAWDFVARPAPTTPEGPGTMVAAGDRHACALTSNGALTCWGDNYDGQLGSMTQPGWNEMGTRSSVELNDKAIAVAAGARHTCAVLTNHTLWCWGNNAHGQLGISGPSTSSPIQVLDHVSAIALGGDHSCAVRQDLTVWCWGTNDHGELGDGTTVSHTMPTQVPGIAATALAAGVSHTCALDDMHAVQCWGANDSGQLGIGTNVDQGSPTAAAVMDAVSVAAGAAHTCAILADGSLSCWGANSDGQLGDGTAEDRNAPVGSMMIAGPVITVAGGKAHTCAELADHSVACWGFGSIGQLGNGTMAPFHNEQVMLTASATVLTTGRHHACAAIGTDGDVYCWGDDHYGQLGAQDTGIVHGSATPISAGLDRVVALSASSFHTCAVRNDATLWCWGSNANGELADGTTTTHMAPIQAELVGVTAIATGDGFTCANTASGTYCIGRDDVGQLGDGGGATQVTPVLVSATPLGSLTAGSSHACGLDSGGHAVCWGGNAHGQIGNSTFGPSSTPAGPPDVFIDISAAADHTCATYPDDGSTRDRIVCWGDNGYLGGNSGFARVPDQLAPTAIVATSECNGVTAGYNEDEAWEGMGRRGQLVGDSEFGQIYGTETAPVVMVGPPGSNPSDGFVCDLNAGQVSCWGDGSRGQLGAGYFTRSLMPVAVTFP